LHITRELLVELLQSFNFLGEFSVACVDVEFCVLLIDQPVLKEVYLVVEQLLLPLQTFNFLFVIVEHARLFTGSSTTSIPNDILLLTAAVVAFFNAELH
jgi:hypothetical protein